MLDTPDDSFDMTLQQMRCDLAALNVQLKLCKLAYLLRKYSPSQPRAPAGSPEGGQWTSGGAGGGGEQGSQDGAGSEEDSGSTEGRSASEGDKAPDIPKERPAAAKERTRAVKNIARSPIGRVGLILEVARWAKEYARVIWSYFDSTQELGDKFVVP